MREILFRGKRKSTGEWVEGLLWKKKYNTDKLFISCFPDKDDNEEVFVVDKETVGQFTGLTDKNGKKIFEGDIIKAEIVYDIGCYPYSKIEIRVVDYRGGCFYPLYDCVRDTYEIIGNIHDNPELLEVK